jgi:translation elongation factor EF-Ts
LRHGRSDDVADRIAAGAVEQYLHDHVFLEQVSVQDPGRTVRDLLFGTEVRITDFVRLDDPLSAR